MAERYFQPSLYGTGLRSYTLPSTACWAPLRRPCGTESLDWRVLTQTLKARRILNHSFTARLKSCPDTKQSFSATCLAELEVVLTDFQFLDLGIKS